MCPSPCPVVPKRRDRTLATSDYQRLLRHMGPGMSTEKAQKAPLNKQAKEEAFKESKSVAYFSGKSVASSLLQTG